MNGDKSAISTDTALQLIGDRRRRRILRHLMENGEEAVPVGELAAAVDGTAATADGERGEPAERVAVELHHVHLPKLADSGVVDYDTRNDTVRYRSHDSIEALVRSLSERVE